MPVKVPDDEIRVKEFIAAVESHSPESISRFAEVVLLFNPIIVFVVLFLLVLE